MITFIDITKNILYIRNKSKQKATAERILIQLKKKSNMKIWHFVLFRKK